MSESVDIAVLRGKIHGLSPADYADALAERFPELRVEYAATPAAERELLSEARVATGYEVDAEAVRASDSLELFVCTFAGTDHLPLEAFEEGGVRVESASGVHGPGASEQVLGYLLTFARRLHTGWEQGRENQWNHYQAGELNGSTVTVVGMGPIGEAILARLEPFGVETIGVRYTPEKGGGADEVIGFDDADFHAALARTDYLVLACPLTDTTEGLVDADAFGTLPAEAVLANVARGPVVGTDALVAALRNNDIRGAALDVTDPEPLPADHPLWDLDDCLITPHNAGHTPEYWNRCVDILADALAG
jgi:phosphoglycerate dehydrogenase-like enzyme